MVFIEYVNQIVKIDSLNFNEILDLTQHKFNITDFYFTLSGKIVLNTTILNENDILSVQLRVNGGFKKVLEKVLEPIIKPFKDIAIAIVSIVELILEVILLLPKLLELVINIFTPDKLINDIIYGVTVGIQTMLESFLGGLNPRPKESNGNKDTGIFGSDDKNKVVCLKPTILNLIILIICPPFALLLNEGVRAWYLVIICALMTYYLYYIPGFIFAALHILC